MMKDRMTCVAVLLLFSIASMAGLAAGEGASAPQPAHVHHWTYTARGDTITAQCEGDCPVTDGLVLRIFAPADLTYDGRQKPIAINGDANSEAFGGDWSLTYTDGENNRLEGVPVDAGTYTGSLELPSGAKASVSYDVAKAPLTRPEMFPEPLNAVYDGTAHALVVAPDWLPEGCVGIQYGLNGDWSDAIPTATEAGTYEIEVRYLGDGNHSDYAPDAPLIAAIEPSPAGIILATMTARGTDALNVTWTRARYVDGYDVYLKKCADKGRYQLVATVEGQDSAEATVTGLSPYTNYKGGVVAWVMRDGSKQYVLDKSPVVHVITGGICKGRVNPASLKLNHANVTLRIGRRVRLNGTVKGVLKGRLLKHVARLRFVSSVPSVASVNAKGDVEALKGGTCVIYVLTNNGIWQSVNVTVDPSPENIWFDHAKKYVDVGAQLNLGARLRLWPGKSETALTWTSSNDGIATVTDNGVVKGIKKGKATISVIATNGKRAAIRIKVK